MASTGGGNKRTAGSRGPGRKRPAGSTTRTGPRTRGNAAARTTSSSKAQGKKRAAPTKATGAKKEVSRSTAKRQTEKYRTRAERYKDPKKARKLADDALKKAKRSRNTPIADVWADLLAMIRMIRAYASGEYRDAPWETMALIIVAVVYFVSPIDLVPDPIPVAGLIDDAAVVGFVVASVKADIDEFIEWETGRGS